MGVFSSEAQDAAVPEEYKSWTKSRNTEMGDMIKGMALEDYKAAAKVQAKLIYAKPQQQVLPKQVL